jgi:hypothetical protein
MCAEGCMTQPMCWQALTNMYRQKKKFDRAPVARQRNNAHAMGNLYLDTTQRAHNMQVKHAAATSWRHVHKDKPYQGDSSGGVHRTHGARLTYSMHTPLPSSEHTGAAAAVIQDPRASHLPHA